ncbi:hypothetical protein C8P68_101820 [Mucilaginibacter yixingensis]|uniref:Uncharacterized protein n=1 Tax=Mucilaginibacter yixingensis TaxID=1295612 RepID=A0A2T5JGN6_9SPHI|nr:hypothetical protein C8P68_101820 [Mucilaginibacter yixingensis]
MITENSNKFVVNIKKESLYNIIPYILFVLVFLFIIAVFPNFTATKNGFQYTLFDSSMFYDVATTSSISDLYNDVQFEFIAYKAYPIFLISFVDFLKLFTPLPEYSWLLCSNLILVFIVNKIYTRVLKFDNPIKILIIFICLIEPSFLGFSLTIEREIFCSMILGLVCFVLLKDNSVFKWFLFLILAFVVLNLRLELLLIIILAISLYYTVKWLQSIKPKYKRFFFAILITTVIASVLSYLFIAFNTYYTEFMALQLSDSDTSGMGGVILGLPLPLRLTIYSVLYCFLPFPAYGIFYTDVIFPYEIFMSVSGITYLFFWIYIFVNRTYIKGRLKIILYICLLGHIILGGTLFNYRHRIDLIVPLLVLILSIVSYKINIEKVSLRTIVKGVLKVFLVAFSIIAAINLVLFIIAK